MAANSSVERMCLVNRGPLLHTSGSAISEKSIMTTKHDAEIGEFSDLATSSTTEVVEDVAKTRNPRISDDVLFSESGTDQETDEYDSDTDDCLAPLLDPDTLTAGVLSLLHQVSDEKQEQEDNSDSSAPLTITPTELSDSKSLPNNQTNVDLNKSKHQIRCTSGEYPDRADFSSSSQLVCTHLISCGPNMMDGYHLKRRCGKVFPSLHQLRVHEVLHQDKAPYVCCVCKTSFKFKTDVMCHMRQHPCVNQDKCIICSVDEKFKKQPQNSESGAKTASGSPAAADKCMSEGSESPQTPDNLCDQVTSQSDDVTRNPAILTFNLVSPPNEPNKSISLKCACGESFPCSHQLRVHQVVHQNQEPFKCSVCDKSFHLKADVIFHMREHPCEELHACDHSSSSAGKSTGQHKCGNPKLCGICTPEIRLKALKQAEALKQSRRKQFRRETHSVGYQTTKEPESMELQTARDPHIKPYKCRFCEESFRYARYLRRHKISQHKGMKKGVNYLCDVCGIFCMHYTQLVVHMRRHTGEKPFSCSKCTKTFVDRPGRDTHERTHTGEKLFSCKECGKSLSTHEGLRKHKLLHTGEKPYRCNVCLKDFRQLSTFAIHKKMHTGESYKCIVCGEAFEKYHKYLQHRKTHGKK